MPVLFREFVFCECGRPAMHGSPACRTCYEDGLRRKWREDLSLFQSLGAPVPVRRVGVRELREMAVWRREEDAERCGVLMASAGAGRFEEREERSEERNI